MWLISKGGFVSLVQNRDDPSKIRARARKQEHLVDTFHLEPDEIIDHGPLANDYRWHADVDRALVEWAIKAALDDVDYTSHAKEEMAGDDDQFHDALLACWRALRPLQG